MNIRSAESMFYTMIFFARTLRGTKGFFTHRQASFRILVMQIFFTFAQALGITALLAISIGAAVNIIATPFLLSVSRENLIPPLLITIIIRELGPLLVAFIVIARSATAIATEIAGMVTSNEVEAYISVGIDPIEHLVVPRFLGVTISMFLLNIYFSFFGLAVSPLISQFFMPSFNIITYFGSLLQNLALSDICISMAKSVVFGVIISITAVTRGLAVERASTEIPVAGLKAVSSSFVWCIVADVLLTTLYYKVLV